MCTVDVQEQFSIICVGENSERTRTAKVAAEEANGIRTTASSGREKEVRLSKLNSE